MIKNHTVSLYAPVTSLSAERKRIVTYPTATKTGVRCNIQPLQLTDCQRNGWGLSDLDANAKIMFLEIIDASSVYEDYIVKWNGQEYFVKGINQWDGPGGAAHTEFKLRPVQGQTYTT